MSNVNPTFAEVTDVVNTIQYLITSKFRDYRAIPDTSEEDWRLETIDLLKKISEKTREYENGY